MNIKITDAKLLKEIDPNNVIDYLLDHGWKETDNWGTKAAVWENDAHELVVPKVPTVSDYSLRMSEVLATLSDVEKRTQTAIYNDLNAGSVDVLRVRALHPESEGGNIPLKDAAKLYDGTYKMLEAAASASVIDNKIGYLPSNKPIEVRQLLDAVQTGQPELGSYVIVVRLPLNGGGGQDKASIDQNEGFGRRALATLADALTNLKASVSRIDLTEAGEQMVEEYASNFIQHGGTSELCEAIEKLNEGAQKQLVELNFTWSQSVPRFETAPSSISIESNMLPVMERFTKAIKSRQRYETVTIKGKVLRFNEKELVNDNQSTTTVTIKADVNGRYRNVRIPLSSEEDRNLVIQAMKERKAISCSGRFTEYKNHNVLRESKNLQIMET